METHKKSMTSSSSPSGQVAQSRLGGKIDFGWINGGLFSHTQEASFRPVFGISTGKDNTASWWFRLGWLLGSKVVRQPLAYPHGTVDRLLLTNSYFVEYVGSDLSMTTLHSISLIDSVNTIASLLKSSSWKLENASWHWVVGSYRPTKDHSCLRGSGIIYRDGVEGYCWLRNSNAHSSDQHLLRL